MVGIDPSYYALATAKDIDLLMSEENRVICEERLVI